MNSCKNCGKCCRLFYINLTKKEYQSGIYQTIFQEDGAMSNFAQAKDCGANFLAKNPDGSCLYLVKNMCSIHNIRPQVCRHFFCSSPAKKYENMIKIINDVKQS